MMNNQDSLTKSYELMEKAMEKAWDMWKMGLTSFTSVQEQIENLTKQQFEQNKSARSKMMEMEDERQKLMTGNQEQLRQMVEEAVGKTYAQAQKANEEMAAALNKQVDMVIQQMKQYQDQTHNMLKETVLNTYLQSEKKQYSAIANLTNQVEDLTKKMISMSTQIQKMGKA
ncbi:MAG: hypothetical protein PHG75_02640 [Syntrophomonas sp.]|nr:hypothetical protein [Syntrophomonas sp.]